VTSKKILGLGDQIDALYRLLVNCSPPAIIRPNVSVCNVQSLCNSSTVDVSCVIPFHYLIV
jgi:hypothetical protein